ncbi:MAG: hypothetical protein ACRCSF_03110 [Mycobacteriaceae bacterium]
MPPRRRSAADALTHDQLAMLAESLKAGRRATVYLREAVPTLGLEAGSSARVISITGTTVTIRPKGIDDELPYEAEELRLKQNSEPKPVTSKPVVSKPVAVKVVQQAVVESGPSPAKTAPRRRKAVQNVSIVIQSVSPEQWSVAVSVGSKRPGKPIVLTAEAVLKAVDALGEPAVQEAVAEVLDQAREAAQQRVAELSAQLEQAQVTLKALGSI